MKKAGQIILIVITILTGISILGSLLSLIVSTIIGIGSIVFELGGQILSNQFFNSMGQYNDESKEIANMFAVVSAMWLLFADVVLFIFSLINLIINAGIFIVCVIASVKAYKAKNKNALIFPAIVSFSLAGIEFVFGGNLLFTIIYALPGIFFMVVSDKDFEPKKEEVEQIKVAPAV